MLMHDLSIWLLPVKLSYLFCLHFYFRCYLVYSFLNHQRRDLTPHISCYWIYFKYFFLSILFLSTISETGEERTFWQAYYMSHSELGHRWHLAKTLLTTLQISTHWFLVMTLDYWLTIRYSLFPATPRSCLSIPRKVTLKPDISCGHFFLAMKSILLDKKIL